MIIDDNKKGYVHGISSDIKKEAHHIMNLLETKLWLQIIIALFLGLTCGLILGPDFTFVSGATAETITDWLALPGNLFLQGLKMIMIPLVFSSIILGIVSNNSDFLKKLGGQLVVYFLFTTTIAITIGLVLTTLINPGSYVDVNVGLDSSDIVDSSSLDNQRSIPEMIVGVIPSNPFKAMSAGEMLGIVIFSVISGLGLLGIGGDKFTTTANLLKTLREVSMKIVKWVMHLAPRAVFGLIAQVTSKIGISAFVGLGMYVLTVLLGLFVLYLFYLLIIFSFSKIKVRNCMSYIKDAQLLAFSTSSSAAVMPLSMKTAEEKLKVRASISGFIIPIGATINMDGTALYQSVAAVFLAQVYGIELSIFAMLVIIATTVAASVGAPSVPGVGIVVLAGILASVGIPAAGIGLILGVDRILDMCRTSLNVTGDLTACSFFNARAAKMFKEE